MTENEFVELTKKIGDEIEKDHPDYAWIDEQLVRLQEYLDLQK